MAKEQDQSMEEILQSIKRIIAEEGETPSGSDVLELTDMIQDDGAVTKTEPAAASVPTLSIEEIMAAPINPEEAYKPEPAPAPVEAVKPAPAPKPEPVAPAAAMDNDALISEETRAASAEALAALKKIPEPTLPSIQLSGVGFRSGTSIEDLVLEGLRPMLKEWLDDNLTGIVERLVEKEIRKLSHR